LAVFKIASRKYQLLKSFSFFAVTLPAGQIKTLEVRELAAVDENSPSQTIDARGQISEIKFLGLFVSREKMNYNDLDAEASDISHLLVTRQCVLRGLLTS